MGILAQTLKRRINLIIKENNDELVRQCKYNLEYKLKNISVNDVKVGCSGFIKNLENGVVIYINTDVPKVIGESANRICVRYAKGYNDFTGFTPNDFVKEETIGKAILYYLMNNHYYANLMTKASSNKYFRGF